MAIDNTPPRLRLIVTIAIIVVITLVGLDFVFKSYYAYMSDQAVREKMAPTLDRDEAFDFGIISKAMKVAHKLHIRELELVLAFDSPEQAATTAFEDFLRGLSHNRRHQIAGRHASRSAALA